MLILVLLSMYFDAVVVFVKTLTFIQIGSGHTVILVFAFEVAKHWNILRTKEMTKKNLYLA